MSSHSERQALSPYLDLARGVAALAVCAGHLRALTFAPYVEINEPGVVWKTFYFGTGLGHQTAIVFFVLSGFLVGRSVITGFEDGSFKVLRYGIRRLTRLWVVLLPGLVLTAFWDWLGVYFGDGTYYAGSRFNDIHVGLQPGQFAESSTPRAFVANVFFLQTVLTPSFRSNGALWSVANDFWYYTLFPPLMAIAYVTHLPARLIFAAVTIALLAFLPFGILTAGIIWLYGAVASILSANVRLGRRAHSVVLIASGAALIVCLAATILDSLGQASFAQDWILGLAFAAFLMSGAPT